MSTFRSSPPASDPHSTNHVNGFNEHSHYDPFFAAPNVDEQLIQISSHTSPASQSYTNPSSSPSQTSRHTSLAPEAQSQAQHLPHNYYIHSQPLHSSAAPFHSSINGPLAESALLSPNATYTSDNGYDLSDHSGTPDFGDTFYPEEDFGSLFDQANDGDLSQWPEPSSAIQLPKVTDSDTYPSQKPSDANPPSAGAVSLASHLMSPALTDNPSPGSRDGRISPTMDRLPVRSGLFENATPYTKADEHSQDSSQGQGPMLQTPTLTGSSIDTSPERPTAHAIASAPSPIFRIESYSRGDSPNRPSGQLGRTASKRSRSSSHLAVEHDDDSSEEEVGQEGRHDSGTTIMPEDPRTGRPLTPGRAGVDPQARLQIGDAEVPNLKEQAENQNLALKIADVEDWLAQSETGSDAGATLSPPPRPRATGRRRAKSAGERTLTHENLMTLGNAPPSAADMHIPGPGLVIDEESGDDDWDMDDEEEEEEDETVDDVLPETPPAVVGIEEPTGKVPEAPVEHQYASPPPLYRAHVWQDPLYDSSNPGPGVKMQPLTANDAIVRFHQRAGDLETLSRAATWGTRRLSESDLEGLFHRFSFKANDEDKEKGDRRGSFLEAAAARLLPKRSQSRRKESEANKQQPPRPSIAEHKKMDSTGSRKETLTVPSLQRKPSLGKRPKSPRIDTGSAVAAMAGQIAAVGAGKGGPTTATASSPMGPWKTVMGRNRSRSDLQPDRSSGNLTDLWTKHGGPPMPTLAAPPGTSPKEEKKQALSHDVADLDEDEEDEAADDKGVTIDLSIRADPIIPTMEGFRSNVRQLNPRLPHFLVERVAQEQLRRYKKLIEFKVKHAQALATGKCPSGKHCLELGGEPTYLPSKSSSKEAGELSHTGFTVAGIGQSDDDANALAEGVVTPAQFPPGVPMPPVKRLPAEFECSLCFKVKKFHKPSDWSKHVHEDVQPFTCTFHSCAEPKSFKRKADWVRHENERHRQLEWWMCNMHDCQHRCYRKDNFVQHLVREHKLPEPKVKTTKAGKPAVRGPSSQKARTIKGDFEDSADELDQVWRLVDECRHETSKNPKDEPCKFCGNICNSWKKLTVHLAKHMEQISMPVLSIAKAKEVTPETIISPIEQRAARNHSNSPIGQSPFSQKPSIHSSLHSSVSPYGSMPRNTVTPMGDLSGSLSPLQTGFYDNQPPSQFHRVQASTYPQPQQQAASNYTTARVTPHNLSAYAYDSTASSNQFVPINQSTRATFQYPPQTSSPEKLYGGMRPPPTSQPRTASFFPQQQNAYPSSTTYPHQGQFPTTSDNSNNNTYGYNRSSHSPPMPGFSQGLSSQSMGAPAPVTYGQVEDLSFAQAPMGPGGVYGQQGQGGGQGYGY
ncbi:MAG: hypothetical protein Q9170_000405 [Blastenia crenularia]